jgi:hypothetical protein
MNRRKNAQERELLDPITRMMQQHIEDSSIVLEMELNKTKEALQFYQGYFSI